jgi:hypothetical protein
MENTDPSINIFSPPSNSIKISITTSSTTKNKKKSRIPPKGDVHAAKRGNAKGGSPRHTKIKGKEKTLTTKDEGRTSGKD